MVEQLWYAWSKTGLGHNVGLQPRAASAGLREINSKRYQEFRNYLNYYLPDGSDGFTSTHDTAPVTLAFLDISKDATPTNYKNTHTVMRKVYKGLDEYGRPGNFFIHLADNLKEDFVASDAIDLWASQFWQVSDTDNPPPPDHSLRQLLDSDLFTGPLDIRRSYRYELPRYENVLKQYLPYVIQAFLSLKPTQKLYIQAPPDQVALLVWGLAHSLPNSLQQKLNLTFSTYEKDVSRFPARVVGTCRAMVLAKNNRGGAQQLLPANAFSGIGPALALDCDNKRAADLSKIEMAPATATALAEYAQKATARLLNGEAVWLAEKLALASKQKIVDVVAFLSFIKTHIDEKPLEMAEVDAKLHNPKQAAHDLSGQNTRTSFLRHYKAQPKWRKEGALPALTNLRSIILDAKNTELTRDEKEDLNDAFFLLAKDTTGEFVQNLLNQNDNDAENDIFEALKDLLEVLLFTNAEISIKAHLLQNAQQYVRYPDFQQLQKSLHWSKRFWLLQQAAFVHNAQAAQIDTELILLWLPGSWNSLRLFLEAKERFPDAWRSLATSRVIQATWASYQSFTQNSANAYWLLEKHYTTLFEAIRDMLQHPTTQQVALKFCIHLLSMIVKRKRGFWDMLGYFRRKVIDVILFIPRQFIELGKDIRHMLGRGEQSQGELILDWKTIVFPVLKVQINPPGQPIDLDELLEAAYLREEDLNALLKEHSALLLTPSHLLSPYVIDICRTFLHLLADEIRKQEHKSNLQQFYNPNVTILERLRPVNFPDENMRVDILDLLCLLVATSEKAFEWYLSQDRDFLPYLAHGMSRFALPKNAAYMDSLYRVILKKLRSTQELDEIIDHLAYIFEGENKQKSHPGDQRKLFTALINYVENGKYTFLLDMSLTLVQLACEYAGNLQENSQRKFLEPVFKSIYNTRPQTLPTFKELDKTVQRNLAQRPDYLSLWRKYSPGQSMQNVALEGTAKAQKQETQSGQPSESGAAKSNAQASANQQGNASQQSEKKNGNGSSDIPTNYGGRPTPVQPSADNQGYLPPASWGYDQGQPAADNIGDPRNQPDAGYQPTQPASTNMQGQIYPPAGDQRSMQSDSHMQGQFYPPANGGQQGGNFMAGQDNQPSGNDMGNQPPPQVISMPEFDILSTVLKQAVTKQQVSKIALTTTAYIPWRLDYLRKELNLLQQRRELEERRKKYEVVESIKSKQYRMGDERDILESLQGESQHEQILYLLENDILIDNALSELAEVQGWYNEIYNAEYQTMQKNQDYKRIIKDRGEDHTRYLFVICMHYCALSMYLRQKEGSQPIKWWIEAQRENAVNRR